MSQELLQYQIAAYGSVVIVTAFVQEWLLCVDEEVEMCKETRIRYSGPMLLYWLSRFATLLYVISNGIVSTHVQLVLGAVPPPWWWFSVNKIWFWTLCISLVTTSLLFFIRVLAIFSRSLTTRILFTALWAVTGVAPHLLVWSNLGPKCSLGPGFALPFNSCLSSSMYMLSLFLALVFHNSFVFVCVTREIGLGAFEGMRYTRSLITGEGFHVVSKSLLRSGQLYFGVTMTLLVPMAVMYWDVKTYWVDNSNFVPGTYVTVSCLVTCRVFRMLLLCRHRKEQSDRDIGTTEVAAMVMAAMARADAPNA
ncbi:hypothetical protein FIBSPDRAFT_1038745 [Athelia psychrophila]|uniref:Transmembrane protein n=1 Tax=Athelia psychrophila TaxID=1759441 RepID=A0A166SQX1_9AGAM|nr:hypothetical protein FIBSPDRAFT_1038745 [Fibularhizoctonia sp. CBS 109695]